MEPKPANGGLAREVSHGPDTLIPLLYKELRRMASAKSSGERSEHTLQPTAVVHEAYLRLKRTEKRWNSETEFRRYVAPVIRHVLVDYARSRPPNARVSVTTFEGVGAVDEQSADVDLLALHELLDRLEKHDAELVRVVELHYFGGLTVEETAEATGIPLGTLKDRLKFARTWLRRELSRAPR